MATQYPSDRYSRSSDGYSRSASSAQPGISRGSSRYGPTRGYDSDYRQRPSGQRTSSGSRYGERPTGQRASSGSRYGERPSGQRASSGSRYGQRPSGQRPSGRRPQRKKSNGRLFAILAALAVVLVVVLIIVARPGGKKPDNVQVTANANTAAPQTQASDVAANTSQEASAPSQYASIAEMLNDTEGEVTALSEEDMVAVQNLSINQSLPQEWMNVLFLGTDERTLSSSSRTDAMMICSINRDTGEVKLTSIMRDLAVKFDNLGKYNGTYGINAAAYFGGPNLAMKTVNELFDMNIQYYVMVNFFGFQKIAQRLGGIEANITEEERDIINWDIVDQAKIAYYLGIDESDQENVYLESYGENTHLNGRQTLAYARIRHLDGGDYMRTTRQQTVMTKLLEKAKQLNALQITQLAADMIGQVSTNMELNDIINLAIKVTKNGIPSLDTFRLPINGTYQEGYRGNESKLWDCDFATNAVKLYDFIYY